MSAPIKITVFDLSFDNDLIRVTRLQNGRFQIMFTDRTVRILDNELDDAQDVVWFFEDRKDHDMAEAIGNLVDGYIDRQF
jgi:hypothetical protein